MTERPIIFSGKMVRAILEGRKTRTRRIVKPQLPENYIPIGSGYDDPSSDDADLITVNCPYGKVGDRLWVRESAYIAPKNFGDVDLTNCVDGDGCRRLVGYSASMNGDSKRCAEDYGVKQSPSIFMPRWASRITLEITGVRVERLQEISSADAKAEGITESAFPLSHWPGDWTYLGAFEAAWDAINGKRASWESNPWVWVVEFRKLD